jgi:hypothetical protein
LEAEESRALSAAVAKREQAEIDARKAERAKKNAKSDVEAAMKRLESRKRLAEKPLRDAAIETRAKVKRVDAARDKLEAVQYLKDNKDYKARFIATIKDHTFTKAVSAFKNWNDIDANSMQTIIYSVCGVVTQIKKGWCVQLRLASLTWHIGTYETIQIANYLHYCTQKEYSECEIGTNVN